MRKKFHQVTVFKSTGLRFIGIAHQVTGNTFRLCQKAPFHTGRKTRTTTAAQTAFLHFFHNIFGRHFKSLLHSCIATIHGGKHRSSGCLQHVALSNNNFLPIVITITYLFSICILNRPVLPVITSFTVLSQPATNAVSVLSDILNHPPSRCTVFMYRIHACFLYVSATSWSLAPSLIIQFIITCIVL